MPRRKANSRPQLFLVIDDLALELGDHPIHVPIPDEVLDGGDEELRKFTFEVLERFMTLPYFTWTHKPTSVVIDGFMMRHIYVYPSFST